MIVKIIQGVIGNLFLVKLSTNMAKRLPSWSIGHLYLPCPGQEGAVPWTARDAVQCRPAQAGHPKVPGALQSSQDKQAGWRRQFYSVLTSYRAFLSKAGIR